VRLNEGSDSRSFRPDSCIELVLYCCLVTIHVMQSIDTHNADSEQKPKGKNVLDAGRVEDLPEGSCKTVELPSGRELALYHVNGEFYASENWCPHKGAPLAEGTLCEHVIECDWHGWQFDVRTGECLTVTEKLETYEVVVKDGVIKILV
jgi:3-phenylpropionate/trans-cinnamate dioxygenase ferredoxin subunit